MSSWPRQQRPAVALPAHCWAAWVLSPAQAILFSLCSSTFTAPSFPHEQFHIIDIYKLFLQLFRFGDIKAHENFVWPFYVKWQHQSESVLLKKESTVIHLLKDSLVWPFYNWWEWKWGDTKTGCEGMGFIWSCTKFKPRLGEGKSKAQLWWIRGSNYW